MTQAVINNLNSLQDVLALNEAKLQSVNKSVETVSKQDFNKILDNKKQVNSSEEVEFNQNLDNKKQVAETSNEIEVENQLSKENSTIATIKTNNSDEADKTIQLGLKAIISAAMEESKVENSLDLTLAKDITEIINQLKEFIESATEDGEIIVDEAMLEKLSAIINSADFQNIFNQINEASENDELQALFAQVSSVFNTKNSQETGFAVELQSIKSQIDSIFAEQVQTQTESQSEVQIDVQTEDVDLSSDIVLEKFTKTQSDVEQEQAELSIDEDLLKELNIESIEAESASSNGESLMQNQTPEEQGLRAMLNTEVETFEIKIDKTMNVQSSQPAQTKTADVNPSKILDQVAKQLEGLQSGSKVNIVLNPESLGRVTVQLIKTGEGLSAQFTVASQEVRDMLMKGLDGLKETLTAQGVGVDNVTVRLSESQKSEYNADWTEQEGSNGGNKEQGRSNKEEKEKGLFEKMMAQTVQDENGNV